jgi:hypothetical protein
LILNNELIVKRTRERDEKKGVSANEKANK